MLVLSVIALYWIHEAWLPLPSIATLRVKTNLATPKTLLESFRFTMNNESVVHKYKTREMSTRFHELHNRLNDTVDRDIKTIFSRIQKLQV